MQFSSVDEARKAFNELNGAELNGRPVRLDYSTPRPSNGGAGGGFRGGRGGGRGGRGGARGGFGRGGAAGAGVSRNRGGIPEFQGKKVTF